MSILKTPFQYLLDITAASRIAAAKATGNKESIAKAERYYLGLTEAECVFSTPYQNVLAGGKWQINVTCKPRGFKIENLRYNTGAVSPMVRPFANIMINKSSLDVSTVTGLYHVYETESDHLLIHPNTNIAEALKMTGYLFDTAEFSVTWYTSRDEDKKADGFVDIKHSVVSGRVYLSIIQNNLKAPATTAAAELLEKVEEPAHIEPNEVQGTLEETNAEPAEGVKLDTVVTQSGDDLTQGDKGEEVAKEEPEDSENTDPVDSESNAAEEEPVVQQQNNNKKKK